MILLLRLLFAHLLGDFFLQSDRMAQAKNECGWYRWKYLMLHSSIHAALVYIVVAEWTAWVLPLWIFLSHLVIDWLKGIWLGKGLCAFILDQLAHLLVLVFWVIGREGVPSMQGTEQEFMWACAVAYVLVLLPSNVFIGLILQRWQVKMSLPSGLSGAGTLIGYLERILVLTFVLTGNIEAVGFLMTAKSVFRFGDLNKEHNLQATEYVLMGTLASFSIAVIVGVLLRALFPG